MGAFKAHTWKELVKQAEIAEKSAKKFEPQSLRTSEGLIPKGAMQLNLLNQRGRNP